MNLVIDIGNTRTKYTVFSQKTEQTSMVMDQYMNEHVEDILKQYSTIDKCILSATGHIPEGTIDFLDRKMAFFVLFSQQTSLPFTTHYKTPQTLGLDRLAGVSGAKELYPDKHVLIIDMGTAITYDLKTNENIHLGGSISPGMQMRFKALNAFTEKLPLVHPSNESIQLGLTTNEAIESGVINGIISELNGFIDEFESNYKKLTIILTGGDALFFANKLKKTIFVVQNLVSTGLNSILSHNAEIN